MIVRKMIALTTVVCAAAASTSFGVDWKDGSNGFTSNGDNWIGGTAPATGDGSKFANTQGQTLFVTNDISYKLDDTTVANGSWEFAGTSPFLSGNALLVGNANETVSIVNYADWTCAYYFAIANAANSTVVFTNRAGTIVCKGNSASSRMPGVTIGGRYNQHDNFTDTSGTFVFEGGTLNCAKSFEVGYGKNCTGYFEQTGGTITADRLGIANTVVSVTGASGTVLLKGGTFATQRIAVGSGAGGTVTFDGGTLKLTASHTDAIQRSDKLAVKVGANGGTILLADGVSSTIPASISSALESPAQDGGLMVKGHGRLAFTGTLSYTGATTVELGATVVVTSSSAIPGDFVVTIPETPPDDGMYSLLTTTGEDTLETFFASVTLPTGDPNAVFRLSADKKSIICFYGDVPQTWIGGESGDLGDATKWSTGLVPTHGNAVITSGSAATLTSSAAFTPDAITFPEASALVTINGEDAIANLLAITNNAAQHHVFNCPVSFKSGEAADITATSGQYVKFPGGMTAYTLKKSGAEAYISGDITLTKDISNWAANVEVDLLHLCAGAMLTIPRSVDMNGTPNFKLDSGTTLVINGNLKPYASSGAVGFANQNNGTIIVNGLADARSHTAGLIFFANSSSSGILKVQGFVSSDSSKDAARFVPNSSGGDGKWVVGESGISGDGQIYIQSGRSVTIYPSSDYTIAKALAGNNSGTYTLATTDYDDSSIGRTVTVDAAINNGKVVVNGNGCVLFNAAGGTTQGLTVNDSATIAVNANKQPCKGAVTMKDTSTLKVAQSGTVTLADNLTLGDNATLAFNFTDRIAAPMLSLASGKTATLPTTLKVKVSAADGVGRPSSSRSHTLTSNFAIPDGTEVTVVDPPDWVDAVAVVDGNIVLTIKPKGFMVIVK